MRDKLDDARLTKPKLLYFNLDKFDEPNAFDTSKISLKLFLTF